MKQSKTDPFLTSCTLHLAPTHTPVCPVRAMTRYFQDRQNRGPFVCISRSIILNLLHDDFNPQACFPCGSLNSLSYRIGEEASALASQSFSNAATQTLGSMRSRTYLYLNYIQLSDGFVSKAARVMATTQTESSGIHPGFKLSVRTMTKSFYVNTILLGILSSIMTERVS